MIILINAEHTFGKIFKKSLLVNKEDRNFLNLTKSNNSFQCLLEVIPVP